jgi:antitoxin component YwqK of YwqJK toxin-antitoxin module
MKSLNLNHLYILIIFTIILSCERKSYYLSEGDDRKLLSICKVDVLGRLNGSCVHFNIDGDTLSISNYKHGKLYGEVISYFSNGNIESITNYENGVENGILKQYFNNGNIKFIVEKSNGKLIRIQSVFDSIGTPLNYGNISQGNGYAITYYSDGNKNAEGKYIDGLRSGWWKYYSNNGILIDSIFFDDSNFENYFGY